MSDSVEHPSHYNTGGVETIDGIRAALGDAFLDYCRGNVIKYVWRCRHKGKLLEDLRKAAKYLEWAIEEAESEKPSKPQANSQAKLKQNSSKQPSKRPSKNEASISIPIFFPSGRRTHTPHARHRGRLRASRLGRRGVGPLPIGLERHRASRQVDAADGTCWVGRSGGLARLA